jgi:osmoprotectant transport system permease protein
MPPPVLWASPDEANNPWFSWAYVRHNIDSLTAALQQHVLLTLATIGVAALLAIPLAIVAHRVSWLSGPILSASGVLYTIPSLGLYALLGPILGLTFGTALIGLVLYAVLVIVRNTLIGLRQVPPDVRDAAAGMGYGRFGLLWRVELPLALPSMVTGLRIATVSTVALVTVCAVVSHGGFGTLILTGFNNNFYKPQIMTATLCCVGLALILDLVLIGLGWLAMPWARSRAAVAR